jgi:hypothetical protein
MPGFMRSSRRGTGQLGRILLSSSTDSPDEQSATPNESGSYGKLMDDIDRLLDAVTTDPDRRHG